MTRMHVPDDKFSISFYQLLRKDRTEHGGGVAYATTHWQSERGDDIDHDEIESISTRAFVNTRNTKSEQYIDRHPKKSRLLENT